MAQMTGSVAEFVSAVSRGSGKIGSASKKRPATKDQGTGGGARALRKRRKRTRE